MVNLYLNGEQVLSYEMLDAQIMIKRAMLTKDGKVTVSKKGNNIYVNIYQINLINI